MSFWNFVIQLKLCINLLGSHLMKVKCKATQMLSRFKLMLYMIKGGPFLFVRVLVMFLIRVFQNARFNRFLRFFASLMNIDGTLRKCYSFSYRYKNF